MKRLLFLGTYEDQSYTHRFKPLLEGHTVYVLFDKITTWVEVLTYCKNKEITSIISTSPAFLEKITGLPKVSISNYSGSFFKKDNLEIVFIDPLKQLVTVPYGEFLTRRYITKITAPALWKNTGTPFKWVLLDEGNISSYFESFKHAIAIAVDIETMKTPLKIKEIGYTGIFADENGNLSTISLVLPLTSMYFITWMRKFNYELKAPKIFQNGKYDIAYLSSWNAVPYAYLYDTATMFHCWYSELPKDLAALGAFFIRECIYWKDMGDSPDKMTQYEYNARDTWSTANVFIQWLKQSPAWAKNNYVMEFPLNFPCHLSEMTGIKRDMEKMNEIKAEKESEISRLSHSLDTSLGVKNFNVASPKQMKSLLKILGCGDLESADEKNLKKAAFRHPLNSFLIDKILEVRRARKLVSTYLTTGEDAKEYRGRILYALNPHSTDTGRLASKEHHFWCGLNIQNQPRGKTVKQTYVADEGFLFGEVDLEQAESRDTAYISGDENLITAVESPRDFHTTNLCAFFAKNYEDMYDDTNKKSKNKKLRDLAKRVNHGANYNMGPNVLVDTMGLAEIYSAQATLGLPKYWTPKQVAEYLLGRFHEAYPKISKYYYTYVKESVAKTKLLIGATGWTRYCFGNPSVNKLDLNAYTAHCPQSLNAMTLNKAYMKVFYSIAMNPDYSDNFKLCAQIHDSILFQFREGHEYLAEKVKECMEIPVSIKSCTGKEYTFTVPAAVKAGEDGKGAKYWSDTE